MDINVCQRPYHAEYTGSRPITEVKQRRARLVLGWVTAWEHRVLLALYFFPFLHHKTIILFIFNSHVQVSNFYKYFTCLNYLLNKQQVLRHRVFRKKVYH